MCDHFLALVRGIGIDERFDKIELHFRGINIGHWYLLILVPRQYMVNRRLGIKVLSFRVLCRTNRRDQDNKKLHSMRAFAAALRS